jgi:hypothetical protein
VSSFRQVKIDLHSRVIEARMTPRKFWFFNYNAQMICHCRGNGKSSAGGRLDFYAPYDKVKKCKNIKAAMVITALISKDKSQKPVLFWRRHGGL